MTTTIDSAESGLIQYVNGPSTEWLFVKTVGSGSVLDATLSEATGPASIVFQFTGELSALNTYIETSSPLARNSS